MSDPLVSVCVVTYNQEKYIAQTLESILSQEHGYSYEIVVGEDCSLDDTRKIVEDYVRRYPDIIKPLYNSSNMGLIKNYFNVLEHCHGKYIMQCAGDDYWLPGKVRAQIEYMQTNPDVGMCYGNVKKIIGDKFVAVHYKKHTCFIDLLNGNCIPALSVCMRRAPLFRYIQLEKPLDKTWLMEDYPMWLWFALNSKIACLPGDMGVYREIAGSVSHSESIERQVEFIRSEIEIKNYFMLRQGMEKVWFDETRVFFDLLFLRAKSQGDAQSIRSCLMFGKRLGQLSWKDHIKIFLLRCPVLFRVFVLLGRISSFR